MGNSQTGGVEIGGSTMGYQVLRVYPDSPGSRAGLRAYFDFIIAIGNTRFNRENGSLREILKASVGQKLSMIVYNTRTKSVRNVDIVPSASWGGNGLLGVSIKHSSFDRADERVWHVVQVEPGSPAQQAGFKANEDYVIGSDSILQENDDLYNLIEAHEGKALKLFVYNIKTDNCREVICYPNSKWGGGGYLGCEFGHGLLHRVPVGNVIDEQGATNVVRNQPEQKQQPKSMPPVSGNPYSFQGQFTQLHNSNTTATLTNNSASSIVTNNFQQRPPMSVQPGEQMLHKALFDVSQQQASHRQQTEPTKASTNQHLHDHQQPQFEPQQAPTTTGLSQPPMPQTMHLTPEQQQTSQQQQPIHQILQQPTQPPQQSPPMQHPIQPPPMESPPVQSQMPLPPQTFAQLAAVHQPPPQHYHSNMQQQQQQTASIQPSQPNESAMESPGRNQGAPFAPEHQSLQQYPPPPPYQQQPPTHANENQPGFFP